MAHSPLPLINYMLWLSMRNRLTPFDRETAVSVRGLENGSHSFDGISWEKSSSAGKKQAGTWVAMVSLSTLVLILYASVLTSLARQWWSDPNYGHGFFVPLFAGYVLWSERDRWRLAIFRPSNFGLGIMLFALGLRVLGMLAAEMFITRLSLVILLAGIVLFLAGRQTLRAITFPIGYLLFMIPLPAIVYYQLTLPLQLWASRLGARGLVALGVHTVRLGNLLILPNCTLNVVEACSGIRSLLALLAAVVAYGYLAEPSTWKRIALAVVSIPIAIATNGLRLVAVGVLSYNFGPSVDSGVVHLGLGLGFFGLASLFILLIHKLLGLHSGSKDAALVAP